jgi:hypothetical protein
MNNEFIPLNQAVKIRELGFDKPCKLGWYLPHPEIAIKAGAEPHRWYLLPSHPLLNQTPAPTYPATFIWFREKYNLGVKFDNWTKQPMDNEIWDVAYQYYINGEAYHPYFKTYEEVVSACLDKLIELIENK